MGLGDDELFMLQNLLIEDPGGGRVIYVDVVIKERIYLLMAYPKNVQTNLSPEQQKMVRKLIESIKEE